MSREHVVYHAVPSKDLQVDSDMDIELDTWEQKLRLNPHWVQQNRCHLNLGNLKDVQEHYITNCKYDCWGWWGLFPKCQRFLLTLHKSVPPLACFDWGHDFGISALNSSSWILIGGGLYSQPYPCRISCHSRTSAKD
ncbi:hypothetical protein J6590_071009 [Homalodisca vitripennis]|nr:hypothetical protein J6590_071009 [Homalodisca vitripennis]